MSQIIQPTRPPFETIGFCLTTLSVLHHARLEAARKLLGASPLLWDMSDEGKILEKWDKSATVKNIKLEI